MKLQFSEQDSAKIYQLLGQEFWLAHKQAEKWRRLVKLVLFIFLVSLLFLAYLFQHLWLQYFFTAIASINQWWR